MAGLNFLPPPLKTKMLDPETGDLTKIWIDWFYRINKALVDFEVYVDSDSTSSSAAVSVLQTTVENIQSLVDSFETSTKISSIQQSVERVQKEVESLDVFQRIPVLPFYLGTLVKFDINGNLDIKGHFTIGEQSADPSDPAEGKATIWMGDGIGTGDDGDLLYMEQSGAVVETGSLKWKDFVASSSTLTTGDSDAGDYTDTQVMFDGNVWVVSEVVGAPPNLDCRLNFTNVDRYPNMVVARWTYNGGGGHIMTIEIYNYTTAGWDQLRQFGDNAYAASMTMYIPQNIRDDYVDGSGNAIVRFYHQSNGIAAHTLEIDYVGLVHSLQGVI